MRITKSYMYLRTADPANIYRQVRQDIDNAVTSAIDSLEISDEARQKNKIENEKASKIDKKLFDLAMKSINGPRMKITIDTNRNTDFRTKNTADVVSSDEVLHNTAGKLLPDLLSPWWE